MFVYLILKNFDLFKIIFINKNNVLYVPITHIINLQQFLRRTQFIRKDQPLTVSPYSESPKKCILIAMLKKNKVMEILNTNI